MSRLLRPLIALFALLLLGTTTALAQPYTYHVYLDTDLRETTGCTVTGPGGQSFVGADYRLSVEVSGTPPVITGRRLASCSGGTFPAGVDLGGSYPVGLNNGVALTSGGFADVIELMVARTQISGAQPIIRVGFAAQSASGSIDVIFTSNGQVGGPGMVVGSVRVIPTLGFFGALLMALALAVLAFRALKRNRSLAQLLLIGALCSGTLAAWAANFIADGQVGDWVGSAPLGIDPQGDSVPPLAATDIVAVFGAEENSNLFFRIDVVDAENQPPVAVNDTYTTLEDTVLNVAAPGVLANDSDPEGAPLTAQLVTGPTRGSLTLNANGSFTYTPNANLNGPDTFTYNAFDGQVTSVTPATVTINVTPVNDAPSFTVGPNQTVLEDAGPQTVNPWATNIDDGDPEVVQGLSFEITNNTNAALFSTLPAVSPTGVLTYTSAPDANGTATITLQLRDNGGTANGGVDVSPPQSFTITVTPVNDAPSFVAGPNQTVLEDAGPQVVDPWATAISPGPPDEIGQTVAFNVTGNTNPALFSAGPAVSPTGALSYTPAANANGTATITLTLQDNGGTANGGIDTSAPQTFTITVTPVNDAPSFTVGPDQTVLEDAGPQTVNPWATNIDDGDPEVVQGLTFEITNNTNAALFSALPAVSPTGVLTYTSAPDANGAATITLQLRDDGGTANGGIDVSPTQSFTITVTPVNDAPTFTAADPPTVLEDAGPQTVAAWATFNPGPPDEAGQTVLAYQVSGITNPGLFAAPPSVAINGTLSYTPAPDANGSSSFTVTVQDSGGTANGGVDTSAPQTFTITVTAVNDAPSFLVGPNQIVDEDAGPQTVNPWATAISAGPPDEIGQSLTFQITANTNPALFSAAPSVSPTGVLSYTSAPDANGVATITLQLMDNGGTANGGVDTSATQQFTITVNAVNDAPVNTVPGPQSVDEDAMLAFSGPATISVADVDIGGGTLNVTLAVDNGTLAVTAAGAAVVTDNGTAVVQIAATLADANATLATLSYSPTADYNGGDTLTVTSNDNGNTGSGGPQTDIDTVAITVNPVNDAPINTVPGAQPVPGGVLVFSTLNSNALSVFDIDADPGNLQIDLSVTLGTLSAVVTPGVVISNNGTAAITLVGQQTALNTALDGLTYVTGAVGNDTLTMISNDLGNTGAGGPLTDTDTVSLLIDEAPSVIASNPAPGATTANNPALSISFSEPIDAAVNYATLTCGGPNLITAGQSGSNVTVLTPSYTGPLPNGANCTLTILAANITDVDTIDPPDNMAADYVVNFTVDLPPTVTGFVPANGAVIPTNASFTVNFSEPVNHAAGGISLNCGGPISGTVSGAGTAVLVFTPDALLPAGTICGLSVNGTLITDVDAFDPPDQMESAVGITVTTDDQVTLLSTVPTDGATQVSTTTAVSFTFSEPVDALPGALSLNCGGMVPGTLTGSGTATVVFTPTGPLPENTLCTATALAANIDDSDSIDPPGPLLANEVISFTTDAAPTVLATVPVNGAIDVSLLGEVTYTFSEPVNFTVASFTYVCNASPVAFNIAGDGTASATLTPTALLPTNVPCTVTALAAGITDVDTGDPPDTMAADVAISFTTVDDQPPSVTASTPAAGDTTANNVALSISFSEAIDAAVNYATLTCGGPNLITAGQSASNVTVLTPTYSGPLPNGAACTLTILAANITDVDLIDPPDNMVADYVVNFTVDAAPEVVSVVPANGATNLSTATTITVNFSEAVDIAAGGITLNCGAPIAFTGGLPASNVNSIVLTPSANLPEGATCNGQVVATLVTDVDLIDPPDQMLANFNWSFTTDAAPTVVTVTPAEAAVVATTQTISVTFSENVDLSATAFTLNCGSAIAMTGVPALPATNTPSIVLTPTGGLPQGTSCVFTVVASEVSDSDSNDPPDTMVANFVRNFSVDAAPEVTSTTPTNGATGVDPTSNITVNFSESVNFDTTPNAANTSFDLECPAGSPADFTVVTASPATSVVLNPVDNGVAGRTCTLTVRAAGITDADLIDPPDNMLADFSASFSFAAIANDDAYTVTPHLTLGIGAASPQGGGVLQNDILGAGVITGFGFGVCTGTAPGNQLDAGAANGRLTLNSDGGFSYEPPAGAANTTRTFCYTVTGGDTANIEFTLQNTDLVWFVDAAAAGGGIGTQARPFQTLAAAAGVDTPNDTIHLAFNASSYIGGIALEAGERLIGSASGSDLATITGITPVAGSGFPALGGSAPTITCTDVSCLTLATGNLLRGFVVGNTGAAGTGIAGTGFGTLTVAELTLNTNGRALNLTTGTLSGNFVDIDVSAGSQQGIALDAVGGTWTVTNAVSIGNVSGTAINLVNTPAGGSASFLAGVTINKTSAGAGINLNGNLAPVNLGATSVTTGAGAALTIDNSSATTTIPSGSLSATGGPALNSSASALAITLASASSTNSATQGINVNNITGTVTINGGAISGSTGTAFQAQGTLGGGVTYAGTISKTSAGRLVDVSGAAAGNLTLSGNLSCTTNCGTGAANHGLRVTGRTGGTLTFSGASQVFNSSATNPAVSLTLNTGATLNFTGAGLAITTTGGTGFEATGGGTVSVSGAANTLTTSTGTAINVANTTIGAAGMTWRSVNSTVASANTTIILTSTGAGTFSVTGTGAAGTGGTISNKTVDAVQLNTTGGLVTLNQMIIEDIGTMTGGIDTRSGHDAIQGLNVNGGLSLSGTTIRRISDQAIHGGIQGAVVDTPTVWTGLTLSGVTIQNTNRYHVAGSGDANNESTVRILGIRGTVSVTNSTFTLGSQPLDLEVTAGTLNLTATGNFFDRSYKEFTSGVRASIGNHCIDVRVLAGATANVTIGDRTTPALGNEFLNCRIGSIRVVNQPGAGANTDVIVARNNFRVNDHSSGIGGDFDFPMGGTLVWNLGSGTMDTIVENNLFELVTNASGGVGQLSLIAEGGPVQALVQNNTFDRPGNAPWWVQARNSAAAVMTARFVGNTVIRGPFPCTIDPACGGGYFAPGLRALADANTGATMNFTMQNNVMARHDTGFDPGQTVEVRALNSGAAPTVCANFQNNQSPDGYSLEQLLGTVRTVGAGTCPAGSPSGNCQTVLGNRGNQGGAGVGTTVPPFVNVFGTVTVNPAACPLPTGAPF